MLDKQTQKLMQEEQKFFGISPGFKVYSPFPYAGMNAQASRQAMEDNEFFYRENFIKVGPGNLRTLWDQGVPIYTAPINKKIIYFFFFNIGPTNYVAIFLNDGTAVQVQPETLMQTTISSVAGTFYNDAISTQIPVCGQWGTSYLLIANNFSANDYWVWDGTSLYTAGSLSPLIDITSGGSGYGSVPTVTAFGGSGTGAQFTATILNGSVVGVHLVNPGTGYQPGDVVQLYFSGGGTDSSAELTAVLAASAVQSVVITNPGTGYTPGTYALGFSGGGGGSGATGTYTVDSSGTVVSTTITAGGSGYTSSPVASFPSGGGSSAAGIVTLTAGTVASVTVVAGGGFEATPTLSFVGGGGTGAAATATITSGTISSVTVTLPGSGYTSAPAVVVNPGASNAASATVTLIPYGISGSAIETFQQRVWITYPYQAATQTGVLQNGGLMNISAPGSFTDFATSDGGDQFQNTDSFLRAQYINIKQTNGYLYPIGDSSVSVISNVQTSGSPSTTTFNYQNTDPQTGSPWRDSVQAYSRTILLANSFGVFGLYGGSVTKVSQKMDNIFDNAVFPAAGGVVPTAAVSNLFNLKAYLINMTIKDPFTGAQRTVMLGWDEREWFVVSQASSYTFIGTREVNSFTEAFGTDGNSLYPMFAQPTNLISKKLSTKLYGQSNFLTQKEAMGVYAQVQDLSPSGTGVSFNALTVDTEHGSYEVPQIAPFPNAQPPYFPIVSMGSGDVFADNLGLTLSSTSLDFSLNMLGIGYVETGSIAMSSTPIEGEINTL